MPKSVQIKRSLVLPKKHSFFLFGPRGSGKSTLIKEQFEENCFFIDLLSADEEERFQRNPSELKDLVKSLPAKTTHIAIDEVQKIPKLLDLVHQLIESTNKKFILTGSSARKLKHGNANLLAGRAFVYNLHPFTSIELADKFNLKQALSMGLLPRVTNLDTNDERSEFLRAYAHSYLKEEVWAEQFIRDLAPFRKFLEVAAQMNGKIINFANISKDVGADDKTIKKYYAILEDTLIGFFIPAYQSSFRKQLSTKPKFYFFDTGVQRALSYKLSLPLNTSTYEYGNAFEHFLILECIKLASYFSKDFRFSYLKTKNDAEIDLVVERPGQPLLLIEIKSSKQVTKEDLRIFIDLSRDLKNSEAICLSQDPYPKLIEHVKILPWQIGLREYFMSPPCYNQAR